MDPSGFSLVLSGGVTSGFGGGGSADFGAWFGLNGDYGFYGAGSFGSVVDVSVNVSAIIVNARGDELSGGGFVGSVGTRWGDGKTTFGQANGETIFGVGYGASVPLVPLPVSLQGVYANSGATTCQK